MSTKWICGMLMSCCLMICSTVGIHGWWDWDIRVREESFSRAKFFAFPPPPPPLDDRTGTISPAPFLPKCPGEGQDGWESCDPDGLPDFEIEIRPRKDARPVLPSEQEQRKEFHEWLEKQEHKKPNQPSPFFEWRDDAPKA